MGVPGFFGKWIAPKKFPGVILRKSPYNKYDYIAIDLNSLIHQIAQVVFAYAENITPQQRKESMKSNYELSKLRLFESLTISLENLMKSFSPKVFILAVDGPAPMAKIWQQRRRRIVSAMHNRSLQNDKKPLHGFDPNCITPGTKFMIELNEYLERWIGNLGSGIVSEIVYYNHLTPGEGEHKIADYLRSLPRNIQENESCLIYGIDADLILISMVSPMVNIVLFRDNINKFLSINDFRKAIMKEMGGSSGGFGTEIYDFSLIVEMIGDDFLPQIVDFSNIALSIDFLTSNYKIYRKKNDAICYKDEEIRVNIVNLRNFLVEIMNLEDGLLRDLTSQNYVEQLQAMEYAVRNSNSLQSIVDPKERRKIGFNFSDFRTAWYHRIFAPQSDQKEIIAANAILEKQGEKITDYVGVSLGRVEEMVSEYCFGLIWIFDYYVSGGSAVNWLWYYQYPRSPLITDIGRWMISDNRLDSLINKIGKSRKDKTKLKALHQLLSVIPQLSINCLPKEIGWFMTPESPIIDIFPERVKVSKEGMVEKWDNVVYMAPIDPNRIIRVVDEWVQYFEKEHPRLINFSEVLTKKYEKETHTTDLPIDIQI